MDYRWLYRRRLASNGWCFKDLSCWCLGYVMDNSKLVWEHMTVDDELGMEA